MEAAKKVLLVVRPLRPLHPLLVAGPLKKRTFLLRLPKAKVKTFNCVIHGDQLNMAMFFWYLVKSDLSIQPTSSHFFLRYQKNTAIFNWSPCISRLLLVVGCSIISVSFLLMGPIRVSSVPLLYQVCSSIFVYCSDY